MADPAPTAPAKMTTGQAVVGTTAGVMTVENIEPTVAWALGGFHQPVPDSVSWNLAAVLLIVMHFVYAVVSNKLAARAAARVAAAAAAQPIAPPAA